MATITATYSAHATLTASTVDTVNLNGSDMVVLSNRGSADIYWTYSSGGTAAAPAVANDSYILPAGQVKTLSLSPGVTQVKLFSTGTPAYSVEGF